MCSSDLERNTYWIYSHKGGIFWLLSLKEGELSAGSVESQIPVVDWENGVESRSSDYGVIKELLKRRSGGFG